MPAPGELRAELYPEVGEVALVFVLGHPRMVSPLRFGSFTMFAGFCLTKEDLGYG